MPSSEHIIAWAREQADRLQSDLRFEASDSVYGGFWELTEDTLKGRLMANVAGGLDFLRRHAGPESEWFRRATHAYETKADNDSLGSGAYAVGEILRLWAEQVEAGIVRPPSELGEGVRSVAATDLMGQVRVLNEDKSVHVAAPIMLAGAALETAMKAAIEQLELRAPERGGLANYTKVLRAAEVITKQDVKDLEQMGGIRNAAAHGEFEELSRERAGLMEQQVNMFLARLATLLGDR